MSTFFTVVLSCFSVFCLDRLGGRCARPVVPFVEIRTTLKPRH